MSVAAVNQRSGALIVTCSFGQLFRSATYCLCEKRKKRRRKINRFPLSGWAVSLACQWSCYSGGTRVTRAHTQSLLTRGKHADRHREQVGTQICTSSSRPRRYRARPPRGRGGELGLGGCVGVDMWGWGCWGGRRVIPSQPPSTVWLSSSQPQMLLSSYKLFTPGYTKGNSLALIVAEGRFIKPMPQSASTAAAWTLLQTSPNLTYSMQYKYGLC